MKKRSSSKNPLQNPANLIGLGLIMVGVLIFGTVFYTAYQKFIRPFSIPAVPTNIANAGGTPAQNGGAVTEKLGAGPILPEAVAPAPVIMLQGNWMTKVGVSQAVLLFTKDMYQITMTSDPQGEIRRYTRGYYTYDESVGKLVLTPDSSLGGPEPIPGVTFQIMTTMPFDIFILRKGLDDAVYWVPPEHLVATRQIHPLFQYMVLQGKPVLRWVKFEPTE